jgi:exosortase C (VPDSG-CTERM-specific)
VLWAYFVVLTCLFAGELGRLARLAGTSDFHSHALLIPFVSGYLIWLRKRDLPSAIEPAPVAGVTIGSVALVALVGLWWLGRQGGILSISDRLSFSILAFVGLVIAGVAGIMGRRWLRSTLFPLCSLLFMVPLPDRVVDLLETGSQLASAEAANALFAFSGIAYVKEEAVFHLPGISLRVAQECSGIRSSLVLLITGAYAANLLLRTTWRRWFLVLFVIPLGIVRNGFRILTIGLLCVHVGPHMVDSPIHHRGGPVFFVLSLIPLLAVVWWLRRGENRELGKEN